MQKEKASILNRIKKKLHIKKDDGNGASEQTQPLDQSLQENKRGATNVNGEDDDMRLYDSDDEPKYVPSTQDNILLHFVSLHTITSFSLPSLNYIKTL